ncbi:uncharacterized protein LOC128237721 [Mya arenaria]|uniref:uncharacterized protein LOC128237721 n=1 Tax=Mya arenaria TaxID=6604 RepID=UPI0022E381E3|nr:uncharacterized protein LOC128237721 [Mya arenaria]
MAKLKSSLLKHAPIVKVVFSVHVRRTDKLKGEAEFHALEEYMNHVADWLETLSLRGPAVSPASKNEGLLREEIDGPGKRAGHETTLSDRFISLFLCLQTPRVKAEPEDYIIPDISKLKHMSEQSLMQIYWKYINRLQVLCKDIIRVGSLNDGGKEICIDEPYKPKTPCLVYSFGINNQFDFDKDINRLFGCDVYCFDPSMERDSFRVADKIWFYNWGLGGENFINDNGWTIKTLDVIRKELKQTNRPIDVLKIDIEGDEWYTIQQMVSSGALNDVKQISMETHYMPGGKGNHSLSAAEQLYFLRQLYDNGFRIYMRERNLCCTKLWPGFNHNISTVNEISLIKLAQ